MRDIALSILFLRFERGDKWLKTAIEYIFQFSFWDSGVFLGWLVERRLDVFQFSFWDSWGSLLEIVLGKGFHFQFSFWDSLRSYGRALERSATFNSLFEIHIKLHRLFKMAVEHFQFSFWDSRKGSAYSRDERRLSILFLRFPLSILADSPWPSPVFQFSFWDSKRKVYGKPRSVVTFNSLFEIHRGRAGEDRQDPRELSILFLRFAELYPETKFTGYVVFQFSFWDSMPLEAIEPIMFT